MVKLYPLIFNPIFKERIWGGRNLETLYHKQLPPGLRVGESWEISDRPGDQSVIANGPLRGQTLHRLMEQCPAAVLGPRHPIPPRFPLLLKIIDAQETLSLQVHPPAAIAAGLGGEPKTEMWYIAGAEPRAELFVGLKKGVTRADFESQLATQTVANCFHRIPVKKGDAMFLPSGRVHALGAGTMIFEIQQNSDTTYRVFDWNRLDAAGKSRDLHVPQSLASINFEDFEPALLPGAISPAHPGSIRPLVKNDLFAVSWRQLSPGDNLPIPSGQMQILAVLEGILGVSSAVESFTLGPGQFCLIPAECAPVSLGGSATTSFLEIS